MAALSPTRQRRSRERWETWLFSGTGISFLRSSMPASIPKTHSESRTLRVDVFPYACPSQFVQSILFCKGFLSVGDLCRQPGLDVVVYVPTPRQFHAEHAQLAMNLGKHVLVEKPRALSLEECRTMVVAARLA